MESMKAALRTLMTKLSFYIAVKEKQRDMLQPSWEGVFSRDAALALSTVLQEQSKDAFENLLRDIHEHTEEKRLDDETKAYIKRLVHKRANNVRQGIIGRLSPPVVL